MKIIKKINLLNFKRFKKFSIDFDEKLNLLIGDNEAGKSSILLALDLVLGGSRNKVETIGLENLFNSEVIEDFLDSERDYSKMPKLVVEVFLNEQNNEELNGKNHSEHLEQDGLKLVCKPIDDYSKQINEILQKKHPVFPFEFYSIEFRTFADELYSNYKRYLKHVFIDNSIISSEYAMREYIKDIYNTYLADSTERYSHHHNYRVKKDEFKNSHFSSINSRLGNNYFFALKTNSKSNVETDLTIYEGNISIDNKGKGKQCFIKTELVLNRQGVGLDAVLLEEPENHLSHTNMKMLINKIRMVDDKQVFIATHSSMISSRLDLRKTILLNSTSNEALKLENLPKETAEFFIKAPDNNILEFILSKKVILVEGDAEYILMEALFTNTMEKNLMESDLHIISVDGTSFKRYLDIAKVLNIKTAVIRDNDGDYVKNCVDNYQDYNSLANIKIFYDTDSTKNTFEVSLYSLNQGICDELFGKGRRTLSTLEYMIQNKADVAYQILSKKSDLLVVPSYIKDAITWISE